MIRPAKIITFLLLSVLSLLAPSYHASGQDIIREREFIGEGLYGFMNGGSDLFYEYGFQKLTVTELTFEGFKYSLEVYRMDCPLNAYGIYSIHVFKPLSVDSLVVGGFDCLSKYQLQAAYGDEYISIVFTDGAKAAAGAEKLLAMHISEKNASAVSGESSTLPDFFPEEVLKYNKPFSGRLRYVCGEISLANIDDTLLDLYPEVGSTYGLWIDSEGKVVCTSNL